MSNNLKGPFNEILNIFKSTKGYTDILKESDGNKKTEKCCQLDKPKDSNLVNTEIEQE